MLHVNFLLLRLLQDFILALVCISASEDSNIIILIIIIIIIIIIIDTQSVQACKA